jgi:AraC-like DNA-binding protein
METVTLFTSQLVTVREVVCDASRGGACGDEYSTTPCVAIPLRGCYSVDRPGRAVVADPNTAVFFDTEPYRVAHPGDDGDTSFVVVCEPAAVADAFGNGGQPDAECRPFRTTHAHVAPALQLRTRLYHGALKAGIVDPMAAEEEAFAIVAALAGTRAAEHKAVHQAVVGRATSFLARRFREPVSLRDVALAAGASPFSVCRVFPAVTGTTLHRYLTSLRLAWTLDAIAAGADDLSRVALDAGFAHHSHFTKTFTRAFGATPRAIRRRLDPLRLRS